MANVTSILAPRQDLAFEGTVSLDASGNYTGSWFESSGFTKIRVAANYNGLSDVLNGITVQEATFIGTTSDGSATTFRNQSVPVTYPGYGYVELDLTARFFRFTVNGGSSNASGAFYMTIRGL